MTSNHRFFGWFDFSSFALPSLRLLIDCLRSLQAFLMTIFSFSQSLSTVWLAATTSKFSLAVTWKCRQRSPCCVLLYLQFYRLLESSEPVHSIDMCLFRHLLINTLTPSDNQHRIWGLLKCVFGSAFSMNQPQELWALPPFMSSTAFPYLRVGLSSGGWQSVSVDVSTLRSDKHNTARVLYFHTLLSCTFSFVRTIFEWVPTTPAVNSSNHDWGYREHDYGRVERERHWNTESEGEPGLIESSNCCTTDLSCNLSVD